MSKRYDVLATREYTTKDGQKKTQFTNVGVAFENRDGKGFSLSLHAIPVADAQKGEVRLLMREPMPPRDGQRSGGGAPSGGQRGGVVDDPYGHDDGSEIPF